MKQKKILIVATYPTHPTNAGNLFWIMAQVELLKQMGCDVFFLYVKHRSFHPITEEYICKTREYWKDKLYEYEVSQFDRLLINIRSAYSIIRKKGMKVDDKYPEGLGAFVNKINKNIHFDACIVNYFFLSKLLTQTTIPKTAISTHDCFTYRNIRVNEPFSMYVMPNEESKALQRAKYIFALQYEEQIFFEHLAPSTTVLNVLCPFEYQRQPLVHNHNMVILASNISYNINGLDWFIRKVLPLVRDVHKDAQVVIGGSVCKGLQHFSDTPGVVLLGYVKYPKDLYDMGDVAINPVYQGTGLKIKTFEAVSYDKITIVHPHSKAGIYDPDNSSLFASSQPEEWRDYLNEIWEDKNKILSVKRANEEYMTRLNAYIQRQYIEFLND